MFNPCLYGDKYRENVTQNIHQDLAAQMSMKESGMVVKKWCPVILNSVKDLGRRDGWKQQILRCRSE